MKPAVADYHYRVLCLRIVTTNGLTIRLANHARDLTMSNGDVYVAGAGYEFTGYTAAANLSPAMVDLEGIIDAANIGYDQVASGVFDNARAYLFATTWNAPILDEEPITASILGKVTIADGRYRIEEMALIDTLNQSVGKTYTAACPKTFGGQEYAGCKVDIELLKVSGTITSVTSKSIVTDSARIEVIDYFAGGTIKWTSGPNVGLKPSEIKVFSVGGIIEVYEAFYYTPSIGDTYDMYPGCRKRLTDCRDKWAGLAGLGVSGNIINFGGFSNIPTSSQYGQVGSN